MWKEFKDFIMTGNVIDFAVAVILAGAVGLVVNGFVSDIVMPVVGHFTSGVSFENLFITLDGQSYETLAAANESGVAVIAYGKWINSIINLLIVGFVLFMIVKSYNKVKKKEEEAPAAPAGPSEIDLLTEIRDALKR
jgi:large conductance mechanosensitive channel